MFWIFLSPSLHICSFFWAYARKGKNTILALKLSSNILIALVTHLDKISYSREVKKSIANWKQGEYYTTFILFLSRVCSDFIVNCDLTRHFSNSQLLSWQRGLIRACAIHVPKLESDVSTSCTELYDESWSISIQPWQIPVEA